MIKPKIFENQKFKALFKEITPLEYLLICFPFSISLISIPSAISLLYRGDASSNIYAYVLIAIGFILVLGIFFLLGFRWRFLYFVILLLFSILLILFIGKPWEYYSSSGRDSAIRIGIEAILEGRFPYYSRTNLGNRPSPLPFTFFLYMPVYFITGGYTFFMNIIILSIFCIVLFYNYADSQSDHLILPAIALIIFSDWFLLEIAINSDVVNAGLILCMILMLIPNEIPVQKKILSFLLITPQEPKKIDKKIIIFALLFGCLLAMRMFVWLIGLIIALYILKIYGLKNTIYLVLISISVALSWILPFMLQDINYFIYVAPMGVNSGKFSNWRSYDSVHPFGHIILDFLNTFLNYGYFNGFIVAFIIILCSFLIGLKKCENKFHLLLIISFCYFIFLFFYFHGRTYHIIGDYVSIAAIPFIFSIIFINFEDKKYD